MASREARLDMGWDLLDQGEFEGALEVAAALLDEESQDPEAAFLSATARLEAGDLAGAETQLKELLAREPGHDEARLTLASVLYHSCRFDAGLAEIEQVSHGGADNPYAHHLEGLLLEMLGRRRDADACFAHAARLDPERYSPAESMSGPEFGAVVDEALAEVPAEFRGKIGALPIFVEETPSAALLATLDEPAPDLLGLFVGTPLTEKSNGDLPSAPDAIYLFKRNLERHCATREELVEEIRVTLLHEIGHFLGMDEEDLDEAGYA